MRVEQDYLRRRSAEEEARGSQASCLSAKRAHLALAAAYASRAASLADKSDHEEML